MHFCTANIAIGGDTRNIMNRDEFAPVSWPEVEVLRDDPRRRRRRRRSSPSSTSSRPPAPSASAC